MMLNKLVGLKLFGSLLGLMGLEIGIIIVFSQGVEKRFSWLAMLYSWFMVKNASEENYFRAWAI